MILDPDTCVCGVPPGGNDGLLINVRQIDDETCALTKEDCPNPNFFVDMDECKCKCDPDSFCYNNMVLDTDTCVCGVPESRN